MRRITSALLLLAVTGWSAPSQAQWWGEGRPAFEACGPWTCPGRGWMRPGPFVLVAPVQRVWPEPGGFGPRRFAGPGWGWRRWAWQREMRLRRVEAWRRWVEAERRDGERRTARVEEPAPRFRGWTHWARQPGPDVATRDERHAAPAEAAVALMPAAAPRFARPTVRAVIPARVLAAAAMIRPRAVPAPRRDAGAVVGPAALRVPEPPDRPADALLRRPHRDAAPERRDLHPVALRSQPAPAAAAVPTTQPAPAPSAPPAAQGPTAPADVPVAPLD